MNVQNITVGNWKELEKALSTHGIAETEITQLSEAIGHDGKTLGLRVKEWIG